MPEIGNRRSITFKSVVLIQLSVVLYTLSGVAGKYASAHTFLSLPFILLYGLEICILGVYAIVWQQIIKRYDLSIAYANRSLSLLWSMLWAVLLFREQVSLQNIIGVLIVLCGVMLVNSDGKDGGA